MRAPHRFVELERLLAERGNNLLAAAVLLTGQRHAAEDLLQLALERVMRRGWRIRGDPEGYLRRTMYRLSVDRWRRLARRREVYDGELDVAVADQTSGVDARDVVQRLLRTLPPRQRAVLVLRYFEQLSEYEAARVLGCSVGTVKSNASRAIHRLRVLVGDGRDLALRC
ncbi:MAG: SigE family RNA polymerase sigma factor [Actinocatenispora sp.]